MILFLSPSGEGGVREGFSTPTQPPLSPAERDLRQGRLTDMADRGQNNNGPLYFVEAYLVRIVTIHRLVFWKTRGGST